MNLNQRLISALVGFGLPVAAGVYTGNKKVYFTFNYDLIPEQFSDNAPGYYRALVQVHFCCPLGRNSVKDRSAVVRALTAAGFGWPVVTDASDEDGQHYVYECEAMTERME